MGVLNVTPDSFSDGGSYFDFSAAVAHASQMISDGADIIDVGGESTRPGAERISIEEEQARTLPVVRELAKLGVTVSIDTMNSSTARLAAESGATIVNDVSGGLADLHMSTTVAELGLPYVAMHWRGHSKTMQEHATYVDVVEEVRNELISRVDELVGAGVKESNIVLDPGLGFAKESVHNWQLLRNVDALQDLGHPLLIGASRKRFLAEVTGDGERDSATAALSALLAAKKVWALRVHDVRRTREAIDLAGRIA